MLSEDCMHVLEEGETLVALRARIEGHRETADWSVAGECAANNLLLHLVIYTSYDTRQQTKKSIK